MFQSGDDAENGDEKQKYAHSQNPSRLYFNKLSKIVFIQNCNDIRNVRDVVPPIMGMEAIIPALFAYPASPIRTKEMAR